jgi:type III secretion protein HrpB1
MATTLAFSTPPGGVILPQAGKTQELGTADIHTFDRVRVFAKETAGVGAAIQLVLVEGNNTVGDLDTLNLTNDSVTRVYEVPGTTLSITANGPSPFGDQACVDVWVWGAAD